MRRKGGNNFFLIIVLRHMRGYRVEFMDSVIYVYFDFTSRTFNLFSRASICAHLSCLGCSWGKV